MKIRIAVLVTFLCGTSMLFAQGKYTTKTGEIVFEASVPSFEEVKAKNDNVSAVLVSETGDFAALALMKGFRFKVALMEEHFNENYMESSTYPKATFKGKIKDFSFSELSGSEKEYKIAGVLNVHGEDKSIDVPAMISLVNNNIIVKLHFVLKPEEFKISIPKVVSSKIAEEINVTSIFTLTTTK